MTTHTDAKQIVFNRDTRDFSAFFDGELIGCFETRDEARVALDDHALRLIEDGLVDLPLTLLGAEAVQPCLHCGIVQERASCNACVEWGIPDGTPIGDYDDVPAGEGEPGRSARVVA